MNAVEQKLAEAVRRRDKIIAPFYKMHSRDGNVVYLDGDSPLCKIFQRVMHCDTVLNRLSTGALLGIDEKIRSPGWWLKDDILIETDSCTVPGHESLGWFYVSKADIVLYAVVHEDENGATCFPIPLTKARPWFDQHKTEFREQMVENTINGRALWTRNLIVPRRRITRELHFEGFILRGGQIVEDFWGKPRMDWLI